MSTHTETAQRCFGANAGLLYIGVAMLLLPVGDTFAKLLAAEMDPVEITMWWLLAQAAVIAGLAGALRHRLAGRCSRRSWRCSACW